VKRLVVLVALLALIFAACDVYWYTEGHVRHQILMGNGIYAIPTLPPPLDQPEYEYRPTATPTPLPYLPHSQYDG